jgi:hypothetical protein
VAIEVPLAEATPPPGTEDTIDSPGAQYDMRALRFENEETAPASFVLPTP